MRVISVHQPWAQLIVDRRRHILIKGEKWENVAQPGDRFSIHASHVRDDSKCEEFGYNPEDTPTNAILGLIEVRKVMDRGLARPSKFDRARRPEKQYAIVVRTVEKYRKPIPVSAPRAKGQTAWEY